MIKNTYPMTPHGSLLGIKNHLQCGGFWLIGGDFAFCLKYAADSYEHLSSIDEFKQELLPSSSFDIPWYELHRTLCMKNNGHNCWFMTETHDEVSKRLGL